jgi:hypothetical protein
MKKAEIEMAATTSEDRKAQGRGFQARQQLTTFHIATLPNDQSFKSN